MDNIGLVTIVAAIIGGCFGLLGAFLGSVSSNYLNTKSKIKDLKNDILSNKMLSRIILLNEYNTYLDDSKLILIEYESITEFNSDYIEAQIYIMKYKNLLENEKDISKNFRGFIEIDDSTFIQANLPSKSGLKKMEEENGGSLFQLGKLKGGNLYIHKYVGQDYLYSFFSDLQMNDIEIESYISLFKEHFDGKEIKSIQRSISKLTKKKKDILLNILEKIKTEGYHLHFIHYYRNLPSSNKTYLYISAGKVKKIAKLLE